MDFLQRGTAQNQTVSNAPGEHHSSAGRGKKQGMNVVGALTGLLLLLVAAIAILLLVKVATSSTKKESDYVKGGSLQAVFLNNGQVYFGNISSLNDKYVQLKNIYYLRVNQTVQPNQSNNSQASSDVSLVKLGCELHGPDDQMLINRDQVTFWENLKGDGQVAKAVSDYVKANPNGQTCATTNASTNTNTNTNTTTNTTTKKQ